MFEIASAQSAKVRKLLVFKIQVKFKNLMNGSIIRSLLGAMLKNVNTQIIRTSVTFFLRKRNEIMAFCNLTTAVCKDFSETILVINFSQFVYACKAMKPVNLSDSCLS